MKKITNSIWFCFGFFIRFQWLNTITFNKIIGKKKYINEKETMYGKLTFYSLNVIETNILTFFNFFITNNHKKNQSIEKIKHFSFYIPLFYKSINKKCIYIENNNKKATLPFAVFKVSSSTEALNKYFETVNGLNKLNNLLKKKGDELE